MRLLIWDRPESFEPMGDLSFDAACEAFAEAARLGAEAGADLIHIETMSDTYECKAAVLGGKGADRSSGLCDIDFDEKGKLLTGGDVLSTVALLEGLGVDALGINCGLGPRQMLPILTSAACEYSVIVNKCRTAKAAGLVKLTMM